MKFKNFSILLICFIISVVSCKPDIKKASILFQLSKSNYSDQLIIEGTVEAVRTKTLTCPGDFEGTIVYLIQDGTLVAEGDTLCKLENREMSNRYNQLLQRVEQNNAEYAKRKANLDMNYAMLVAQVKTNEAQTSITNLDSAQLQYASPYQQKIRKLEMQKAAIQKEKLQKKLKFLEKINESQLKTLKLQVEQSINQAKNIKSDLDKMNLLAPQAGLALRSNSYFHDGKMVEGDIVWGRIPIVNIPDMTEMRVKIFASESEYKRIELNDKVTYTFSSKPGIAAFGKISVKPQMGVPINRGSKVKQYEFTATVDSFDVIPEPGISANCAITLKEIPDTIVIPQLAIFDIDSLKVVFVKKNNNFEKREVLLGENSIKYAVITAGLIGNEVISFEKPQTSKIKSTVLLADSLKKTVVKPKVAEPQIKVPDDRKPPQNNKKQQK